MSDLKVLLIEDSVDDAAMILRALGKGGFKLKSARVDSAASLRTAVRNPWDVILCDYSLPGFSLEEALAIVRKYDPIVPMLVVSGVVGEEAAAELMRIGASDVLLKPNIGSRLVPAVSRELTNAKARRHAAANEATLRLREQQIVRFTTNVPGLVYQRILRLDGSIEYPFVGGSLLERFGLKTGAVAKANIDLAALVHPDDRALWKERILSSAASLTPLHMEIRLVPPNGELCWFDTRSQPRRQPDGSIIWDAIAIDVTERRLLQERLGHAQKMEAIGNLVGGMAHDFNNLLQVILINSGMLRERVAADRASSKIGDTIIGASRRGADLIRHLLAFSRRQSLAPAQFDMGELAKSMIRLLRDALGEDIEVELKVAPDAWPAFADPAQVESALANLAVNARDAMPQGGKLLVCVKNAMLDAAYAASRPDVTGGDYVLLEVSDTGTGMPPEVRARAFEPFFTTKGIGKGTGLGLSTIYGFAKQSGGHVSLYSEQGKGTTVRLYLPRAVADRGVAQAGTEAVGSVLQGGNELILVVDDNHDVRKTVQRALEHLGYRVIEADGPQQALELLSGAKIDLLFTDIVMPGGVYGPELARQALERHPGLKVLLTSGFPEEMQKHVGTLPANNRVLAKPYTQAELAARVRKVLDTSD